MHEARSGVRQTLRLVLRRYLWLPSVGESWWYGSFLWQRLHKKDRGFEQITNSWRSSNNNKNKAGQRGRPSQNDPTSLRIVGRRTARGRSSLQTGEGRTWSPNLSRHCTHSQTSSQVNETGPYEFVNTAESLVGVKFNLLWILDTVHGVSVSFASDPSGSSYRQIRSKRIKG